MPSHTGSYYKSIKTTSKIARTAGATGKRTHPELGVVVAGTVLTPNASVIRVIGPIHLFPP